MIEGLVNALKETVKEVPSYKDLMPKFNEDLKSSSQSFEDADKPLNDGENRIKTRNEDLEGKTHPETGVPFEKKTVENESGESVEVVVPIFDSTFDAQLPKELYEASDKKQFDECNSQLKEAVSKDTELREKFTKEQLEQIEESDTPDGYVWHHDAETGKMQLVDSETHAKTGHTGGKSIWGGGSENR
jgi:vacuolar-type H+-ATPase subunit D/Vma8